VPLELPRAVHCPRFLIVANTMACCKHALKGRRRGPMLRTIIIEPEDLELVVALPLLLPPKWAPLRRAHGGKAVRKGIRLRHHLDLHCARLPAEERENRLAHGRSTTLAQPL